MSLAAGTKIGPYKIQTMLGKGGMGEVYLAHDDRLQRDVALKVLSVAAKDEEAQRRFEHEARAAGSLNHPNILVVYDVGIENGISYIATELVDGESLRTLIDKGPLPVRDLLAIAIQVADGLAAAHAADLVHRDLKPENIMISRTKRVKILDFGLAKSMPSQSLASSAQTLSILKTREGHILGTFPYMSPEQAAGKEVDFHSDQFSFGLMLFEMAIGTRAFHGDSVPQLLSAIIEKEPPSIAKLNPRIPPPLRWTIERCLSKDPSQRYDSTVDLHRELRSLFDHLGDENGSIDSRETQRSTFPWIPAMMMIAAVVASFIAFSIWKNRPSSQISYRRLTFRRGFLPSANFGPDGQTIYYSASWDGNPMQIYSTRVGSPESTPLPLPSALVLSISAGGNMLIGYLNQAIIGKVALAGGAPRELLNSNEFDSVQWMPDNESVAAIHTVQNQEKLEAPIGKAIYQPGKDVRLLNFEMSPSGNQFAVLEERKNETALVLLDVSGNTRDLLKGWAISSYKWAPSGKELWFFMQKMHDQMESCELWAVNLSGKTRLLNTIPGLWTIHNTFKDGRVLLRHSNWVRIMQCKAPGAEQERDISWFDDSNADDLLSDGSTVLFNDRGNGSHEIPSMFVRNTDGSPAIRLGEGYPFALSPNKTWVAGSSKDQPEMLLISTGAGATRKIDTGGWIPDEARWFSDNKRILFLGTKEGKSSQMNILDIDSNSARAIGEPTKELGIISPDEKMILASTNSGYRIYPVDGGSFRKATGFEEIDELLRWDSSDVVYVRSHDEESATAKIFQVNPFTGKRELWKKISPSDPSGVVFVYSPILASHGSAYCYSFTRTFDDLYLVDGLK